MKMKGHPKGHMHHVVEGSHAIAEAARQCRPGVIAAYPITPQTHIIEKLSEMVSEGKLDSEFINVESEHSAMSACIGASASGVRTFTSSSSQGLALMSEMLFVASGLRLPVVMAVANRALSSPLSIWNDHSDTMAQRDSGWIQIYCESSQEAYDSTIQAFRISEKVYLPVMVCVDGFTISHVFEPVSFIDDEKAGSFAGEFKPKFKLDPQKPVTMGPITMPDSYMHFKKQQHDSMMASKNEIKKTNLEFAKRFGRKYGDGLIETYKIEDAEYAILGMGSLCSTARVAVDELRKKGRKIGLIKIRAFRPFPSDELKIAAKNLKGIAVFDRAISPGNSGPLYNEVKSSLSASLSLSNIKLNSFITALGGRDINVKMLSDAVEKIGRSKEVDWLF
jgi:pyruvate ferredoxin oxidoreductase alpha subunit